MRILVDECVPAPIQRQLTNHACSTVQVRGWGGIKNGELLQLAEGEFDVFITSDQNIRYQQNLAGRRIAILELSTNDIARIQAASALIEESTGATMSFFRHGEDYRPDDANSSRGSEPIMRSDPQAAPPTIGFDESPAGYSLASCSPSELASASPADPDSEAESTV